MKICLFLAIVACAAPVFAQVAPVQAPVEIELVVQKPTAEHPQPHWFLAIFRKNPCQDAAVAQQCAGSPRDIAYCLAESEIDLAPSCARELMREAMVHEDVDLLHKLAARTNSILDGEAEASEPEPEPTPPGPHSGHHKHDEHVHPIVSHLRQTCNQEFEHGICGFALANRVCPRKLLK